MGIQSKILLALALTGATICEPISAQSPDQLWLRCENEDAQFDRAEQFSSCTKIIESNAESTERLSKAYNNRGIARRNGAPNDWSGAIADYTLAISLDRQNADALANRGYAYQYGPSPDFARAISDYSEAIALKPIYAWLFYNRGNAFLTAPNPDFERAIADYTQAVTMNSNYAYAFNNRGLAYQWSPNPDFAKAIADHSRAIALYPELANAYANRSLAYLGGAKPNFALAIADSDRAVELDPDNADFQNTHCWVRAIAGRDLKVARAACDLALRLAPENFDILDSRGLISLREKRWQDAWNDFDAAAQRNPMNVRYLYGRGIAGIRLGQKSAGLADIDRATKIEPGVVQSFSKIGISP